MRPTINYANLCFTLAFITAGLILGGCSSSPDLSAAASDQTITLIVDVENITQNNILQTVRFEGQTVSDPRDHLTEVGRDEVLEWVGRPESTTPEDRHAVLITQIRYEKETNVLRGRNHGNPSNSPFIVRAQVKGNESVVYKEEKYAIQFRVFKNGRPAGTFTLDPKLKVYR